MFNTVLLTVDLGHEASWRTALPQAVGLVQTSGGTLHVLTVLPDFGFPEVARYFPADYRDTAMTEARAELDALIAQAVPKGVSVTPHVGHGALHEVILDAIDKTGADLVVMASHAPDRVREFLVGSQADRVVRRSPVSVLVVRG